MAHPAVDNLRFDQRQLDMDGCEVGVSRQALVETLAIIAAVEGVLAHLEERGRNSRSFGSHADAYEIAARRLRGALDPAVEEAA